MSEAQLNLALSSLGFAPSRSASTQACTTAITDIALESGKEMSICTSPVGSGACAFGSASSSPEHAPVRPRVPPTASQASDLCNLLRLLTDPPNTSDFMLFLR